MADLAVAGSVRPIRKGFRFRKPSSIWVARFSSQGRIVLPSGLCQPCATQFAAIRLELSEAKLEALERHAALRSFARLLNLWNPTQPRSLVTLVNAPGTQSYSELTLIKPRPPPDIVDGTLPIHRHKFPLLNIDIEKIILINGYPNLLFLRFRSLPVVQIYRRCSFIFLTFRCFFFIAEFLKGSFNCSRIAKAEGYEFSW